jgi:hypothetical protein
MRRHLFYLVAGIVVMLVAGIVFVWCADTRRYLLLLLPSVEGLLLAAFLIVEGLTYFIDRED